MKVTGPTHVNDNILSCFTPPIHYKCNITLKFTKHFFT